MRTWFTADHHFGHENIIRYCDRPYKNLSEMNRDMTRRWNEIVAPRDVVYYLGDFAMGREAAWPAYRKRLHGRIILIRGNHDRAGDYMVESVGFAESHDNIVVEVDGVRCWLNHYPPTVEGEEDHRGRRGHVRPAPPAPYDLALCGHIHQLWRVRNGVVNVGVDVWSSRPISVSTALAVKATEERGDIFGCESS